MEAPDSSAVQDETVEASFEQLSLKSCDKVDDQLRCCVVVTFFNQDLSTDAKERLLSRFYVNSVNSAWISPHIVVFAYRSERKAISDQISGKQAISYRAVLAAEYDGDMKKDVESRSLELVSELKPVNDTRTAKRMIGAALGIRIPSANVATPVVRKPSPPRVDAWDD